MLATRWQAGGTLARALHAGEWSLADVRAELLRDGTGLLVFVPGEDVTHLFTVECAQVRHWLLGRRSRLTGLAQDVAREIGQPPADRADAEARARAIVAGQVLGDALLPAEARDVVTHWRVAVRVGADLIAAHRSRRSFLPSGETLGAQLSIAYLPSIPAALGLAARKRAEPAGERSLDLLMLAATVAAGDEEGRGRPLRPRRPRPAQVASALRGRPSRALERRGRDSRAPAAALRGGTAGAPRDDARALRHRARAARGPRARAGPDDDGRLWCEDVAEGVRAAPLVLLSACGAARGPARPGDDGVVHLGGAFLAAEPSASCSRATPSTRKRRSR
jgi:hypothetical protein